MKLEQYQIEGANFLAEHPHALLGDDMGLGKTAQAVTACDKLLIKDILIICPASVKYHWKNEFEKWSDCNDVFDIVEGEWFRFNIDANIVIVNYELLLSKHIMKELKGKEWDVLICDEAHYLKTLTSSRSKKVLGSFGLVKNARYKWMLTGTPIENRPVDLFPMMYVLANKNLGEYNTYEKFVMRYCNGYYDRFSGQATPYGASHEEELAERLKGFMLRRTLENELPETVTQVIRMKKNIKVAVLEENLSPESYFKPMAELGALASLRQEVALAKLPQCVEYIKDTLKIVDKLVVFAYHRSVIHNLAEKLKKYKPVKFYGGLNANQRENVKNYFIKEPKCGVFIGQLDAAGTGLDGLQKVCHHMIFVEIDWVPFKQCVGRLKRKGQKADKVVIQMLVCKDSVEEQMLGSVESKLKSIDKILGDKK